MALALLIISVVPSVGTAFQPLIMPAARHIHCSRPRMPMRTIATALEKEKEPEKLAVELEAQARALREEVAKIEASMQEDRRQKLETELDDFFRLADANGDGQVSLDELRSALRKKLVDENSNSRSAARAADLLDSEERVLAILRELDANADGVLQREEMISVASFRDRLEKSYRSQQAIENAERQKDDFEDTTQERLEIWEAVANRTSAPSRLVAAAAYLLPALDALPYSLPPPGTGSSPVVDAAVAGIVQAAVAFRALPFSGLIAFLVLSALAGNVARPRLERFAARHAILMDLAAVIVLPVFTALAPKNAAVAATSIEVVILISALAAALAGINADFVPGTGTLTKKFTDDFDASVKNLIQSATAAEFSLLINSTLPINLLQRKGDDEQSGDK